MKTECISALQEEFHQILLSFNSFEQTSNLAAVTALIHFLESTDLEKLDFNQPITVGEVRLTPVWMLIWLWEKGYGSLFETVLTKISDEKLNTFNFNVTPNIGALCLPQKFFMNEFSYFIYTLCRIGKNLPTVFLNLPLRLSPEKFQALISNIPFTALRSLERTSTLNYYLALFLSLLLRGKMNKISVFIECSFPLLFLYSFLDYEVMSNALLKKMSFSQLSEVGRLLLIGIKNNQKEPSFWIDNRLLRFYQKLFSVVKVAQIEQLLQEEKATEAELAFKEFIEVGEKEQLGSDFFYPLASLYKERKDFTYLEKIVDKLEKTSQLYVEACYELAHHMLCRALEGPDHLFELTIIKAFNYAVVGNKAFPEENLLSNITYYYLAGKNAPLPSPQKFTSITADLKPGAEKACFFTIFAKRKFEAMNEQKSELPISSSKRRKK